MPTRNRSRSLKPVSGTGSSFGNPVTRQEFSYREQCTDVIGDYGGNHTLSLQRVETSGSRLVLNNWLYLSAPEPGIPSNWCGYTQGSGWLALPSLPSYVNRVLASTGPLTPNVNLPLFLFELKDVPGMLRHAGNLLHKIRSPSGLNPVKEAAAANLAYKFGWDPLISDLWKLLDFADAAKRQQRRIKSAYTQKGVRRRVRLDTITGGIPISDKLVWSTHSLLLYPKVTGSITSSAWATVRWRIRDPNLYGYEPSFNEALRTSLGFNLGQIPISIWKALPWSWMIDWFTDISSVMQANYNSMYFKPYRLSIMRKSVTTMDQAPILRIGGSDSNFLTSGTYRRTFLERYPNNAPTANVTLRLPFMDGYKLSVLGSLAILRIK